MTLNDQLAPIATPAENGIGLRPPSESLDPRAMTVWRIGGIVSTLITTAIVGGILYGLQRWREFGLEWVIGGTLVVFVLSLAWDLLSPGINYRYWRYEIREDEVDLLHGIITRERQIVPMARIQHVDTSRGPIQRRHGLATVKFHTASGAMEIPQLSDERAAEVRDMIAERAGVHDDL